MTSLPTDAQERKKLQLFTFMFGYFADAWLEVVRIARLGNDQHNPGEPLHWARGKSTDQMNAAFNHIFDYGLGNRIDSDGGRHLSKAIWRLMAQDQLDIEEERRTQTGQFTPKPVGYTYPLPHASWCGLDTDHAGHCVQVCAEGERQYPPTIVADVLRNNAEVNAACAELARSVSRSGSAGAAATHLQSDQTLAPGRASSRDHFPSRRGDGRFPYDVDHPV